MSSGTAAAQHLALAELEAGLETIRNAPRDSGTLELIVRRPRAGEREVLPQGDLSLEEGLVGDSWKARGSASTPDGSANRDMQLTVMNSRVIALLAEQKDLWPLAGDQLFIDMDISSENMPPGTQLTIGSTVIEISNQPHTGCKKFLARFGADALKFVNSPLGKQLRLRGANARIVRPGKIYAGDVVKKAPLNVHSSEPPVSPMNRV